MIHFNPWVSRYLGLGHGTRTATVAYKQLINAAGPYSGVSFSCKDTVLAGMEVDNTVLTLRAEAFGWYSVLDIHTVANADHCKCTNTPCPGIFVNFVQVKT